MAEVKLNYRVERIIGPDGIDEVISEYEHLCNSNQIFPGLITSLDIAELSGKNKKNKKNVFRYNTYACYDDSDFLHGLMLCERHKFESSESLSRYISKIVNNCMVILPREDTYVDLLDSHNMNGDFVYVKLLESFRRMGAGKTLLQELKKDDSVETIFLEPDSGSIEFYTKHRLVFNSKSGSTPFMYWNRSLHKN